MVWLRMDPPTASVLIDGVFLSSGYGISLCFADEIFFFEFLRIMVVIQVLAKKPSVNWLQWWCWNSHFSFKSPFVEIVSWQALPTHFFLQQLGLSGNSLCLRDSKQGHYNLHNLRGYILTLRMLLQINQKPIQTPASTLGPRAVAFEIEVVPSFRGTMSGEFKNDDGSENRER